MKRMTQATLLADRSCSGRSRFRRPQLVRLEERVAPSATVMSPKAILRAAGFQQTSAATQAIVFGPSPSAPFANPAFDQSSGRGLPGNGSRISDPLLRLYNDLIKDRAPQRDGLLQVSANGEVAVQITGYDIAVLNQSLAAVGFQKVSDRPEYHLTEGTLPVSALPAVEALSIHGLLGVVPIYRPETGVGSVTSQADWASEADRTRISGPQFVTGNGVRVGILSDSYDVNVGAKTNAAQDIASKDLPAGGVKVWQEGPASSSDEGRAMLQLVHDVAPNASLSFASAFFGQANFADQIKILANPAQGDCQVISDDIFYFEEPMFQDGLIAQAIDNVVTTRGVSYFALAGNHANTGYENVGWTETNTDPLFTRLFDFDPAATIDTRQRIQINNFGFARIVFQWDDPFFTSSGVDTNLDLFLLRSDTGAIVAAATDNNIATQVPSELLEFTNTTGQTEFDILIRRNSGPNPGRIKYVHLGNGSPITITEFFDPNVSTQTPHSAAVWAEGVGAVSYSDRPNPESFTSQGGNTIVFDAVGNPIAPQLRSLDIAGLDNVDNTFFGSDTDGNGFPNFRGTSAAAPNVAAVAALLLEANPAFSPSSVYSRLESRADDVYLPGIDNKTGAGLVNAFDAVVGTTIAHETNFSDGFELAALDRSWETHSTGAGRIEVTSSNSPAGGEFHVTLDSDVSAVDSLNEMILHANLANVKNAVLSFRQREFSDEDHPMPATFSGSGSFDGVALSTNGTNWFTLVSLTGATSTNLYTSFSFNLNKFAADNGLVLNSNVRIKFQQFDNGGLTSDGMAFDDIAVTRTGTINGISYDDVNGNGKQEANEPARVGQTVYVDADLNGRFDFGNAVTYAAPQLPMAIRDLSTVRVPLTIAAAGTISDVDVAVDISHTFVADLDIFLIAPNGLRIQLSTDNGGSGDNYKGTVFDDEAATAITTGSAPFTGRFRPEGMLSVLDGTLFSGTWYLEITDDAANNVGTLNSWSLTLSRETQSADVPKSISDFSTAVSAITIAGFQGAINDIDITIDITHPSVSDLDIFLMGPGSIKVELSTDNGGTGANYTDTTFDDEANVSIIAGKAPFTGRFRPEGSLSAFDGLSPNASWILFVSDDSLGSIGSLNSWSITVGRDFTQDLAAIPVPDPGTAKASLVVAGLSGPIVDLDVNLNLTQTIAEDFDAFLISPLGTKLPLFSDVGGVSDNFLNLTLDDAAMVPIEAGLGPFNGSFRPESLLSTFHGQDANGTWMLEITDDAAGGAGTIVDWSLTMRTAAKASNTNKSNISDFSTLASSIGFSNVSGAVNDVNVTLDITHTFAGDLDIYLIAPGGARIELSTDNGSAGDNYSQTTFDDEAATSITTGSAPFTGSFRPEGSLATLDGINPNGTWFLEISDDFGFDTGTLNSWSITLSTGELHAVTKSNGTYELPNFGAGTVMVREQLPPGFFHTQPTADQYILTFDNSTSTMFSLIDFGSQIDPTGPTADVTPVSPDPRNASVASVEIVFSEAVTGFDIGDLMLTLDAGPNLLTAAQFLTTVDNTTFVVENLALITTAPGVYRMAYNGIGSGVVDRALNAYTGFTFDDWTTDTTPPTAKSISRSNANPTAAANIQWKVSFDEPVQNLAATNFTLVNGGLGGAPAITSVLGGPVDWTITASTGTGNGTLGLSLTNPGTLSDLAGNPIAGLPFVGEVYNVAHSPPKVLPLVVNNGAIQRSRVTTIRVDFDQLVTFVGPLASAFELKRQSDNSLVALSAFAFNTTTTTVTFTFVGGPIDANSLADGRYTLTAFAGAINGPAGALDGNGDNVGGDDFVLMGNPGNGLFRLFGDADGNGNVGTADFNAFRGAFGGSTNTFDFDNDGSVSTTDFNQFRTRFGSSV